MAKNGTFWPIFDDFWVKNAKKLVYWPNAHLFYYYYEKNEKKYIRIKKNIWPNGQQVICS